MQEWCDRIISPEKIKSFSEKKQNEQNQPEKSESRWCYIHLRCHFLWKGKVTHAVAHIHINFISLRERESGRGGNNWRWQIESLATCVLRHLQTVAVLAITNWPTEETRSIFVHSATNHLPKLVLWRLTPSFTLGRNRTSAHNATFQPIRLIV